MIQRIQTVYLILAVILMGAFMVLPVFSQNLLKETIDVKTLGATDNILALVAGSLVILMDLIGIFSFKNRSLQIKTIWAAIVFNILLALILGYWYTQLNSNLIGKVTINFVLLLPFITLLLNVLAVVAVRRDEKLVKSLDRLR